MRLTSHNSRVRIGIPFWLTTSITMLIPFIVGCSLTVPTAPDNARHTSPAVSERAGAGEIWQALAHSIKARTIGTTTQLAQYVVILARNGELTQEDVAEFDAAFPRIAKESRAVTDADANTLIGLGKKAAE